MKYPKRVNGLRYAYIPEEDTYRIENGHCDCYVEVSPLVCSALQKLDGNTSPRDAFDDIFTDEDVAEVMKSLKKNALVKGRFLIRDGISTFLIPVFTPKKTVVRGNTQVAYFFADLFILAVWLPMLIFGTAQMVKNTHAFFCSRSVALLYLGEIVGLISGMILHEMSHFISGRAYGARIHEAGIGLKYLIFPIAYVMIDERRIKRRLFRLNIYFAGIEMNFLLSGVFMLMNLIFPKLLVLWYTASFINITLGLTNLIAFNMLDGGQIARTLLSSDEEYADLVTLATDKQLRRTYMKRKGVNGIAVCALSVIVQVLQIMFVISFFVNYVYFGVSIWK